MLTRKHTRAQAFLSVALAALLAALPLLAARTQLKPGWNMFKPEQDIEFGREATKEAEQQLPMLNNREVDAYINRLGQRLAEHAPGYRFPYQFKTVNAGEINAFALPGGPIYINRGTIEAAENESQLAGVMAHEISHVALRHGTNQLTKAAYAQGGLGILGGLLGSGSGGASTAEQIAGLGIQLGFSSVFLKFSRTAESQADIMGTQILYDAGYDTKGMADFFDVLQQRHKTRTVEFFSSHPNPENRVKKIEAERAKLGAQENPRKDSDEFRRIQRFVASMPPPPKPDQRAQAQPQPTDIRRPAELPSRRLRSYRHSAFAIGFPENWEYHEQGSQVLFAPPGGAGQGYIAYGVLADAIELQDPHDDLDEATDKLVQSFLQSQRGTRVVSQQRGRVDGKRSIVTRISGPSPFQGEQETDTVITVRLPEGLFFALFIVPDSDSRNYQPAFSQILDSIRFR
ncbi:MAG: M48 family metallopeptidase [Acidobacteria bacterium]|nr:M48 family metallopeptidase [Acidobacteriota bacterium]